MMNSAVSGTFRGLVVCAAAVMLASGGCRPTPPPPRVSVPTSSNPEGMRESDTLKPMPPRDERIDLRGNTRLRENREEPPPATRPAGGETAVESGAQVRKDFIDAYQKVGRPRIVVLINRTPGGKLISEDVPKSGVTVGAGAQPGDVAALENALADLLMCDKQVTVTPPSVAREKLTDPQVKSLEDGDPQSLASIDSGLNADVLVQGRIAPKAAGDAGTRLMAEIINVRGGQIIGHAEADLDRLDDRAQVDGAAHFVAQKLMIDMLNAWTAPEPADHPR